MEINAINSEKLSTPFKKQAIFDLYKCSYSWS